MLLLRQRVGPDRGNTPPMVQHGIQCSELERLGSPPHGLLELGFEQRARVGGGVGQRRTDRRAGTCNLRRRHAHPPSIPLPPPEPGEPRPECRRPQDPKITEVLPLLYRLLYLHGLSSEDFVPALRKRISRTGTISS